MPGAWYRAVDRYEAESPPNQIAGGKPSMVITRATRPKPNATANRRCLLRKDRVTVSRLTPPNPATGSRALRPGPPATRASGPTAGGPPGWSAARVRPGTPSLDDGHVVPR